MEDLIKFVTTEQSRRSEAFIFFWRILMAILMANHSMENLNYHFVNAEIKLNTVIDFFFSQSFIYASIFYLLYVFLFFWAFKYLSLLISVIFSVKIKPFSRERLKYVFIYHKKLTLGENNQVYITSRDDYNILQDIAKETLTWFGSDTREKLYSYLNVLFSTYFWFNSVEKNTNFPLYINYFLLMVTIIAFLVIMFLDLTAVPFSSLQSYLLELKRLPFFEELTNESDSNIPELPQ